MYGKRDKRIKFLADITTDKDSFNSFSKNLVRVEKIYSSALNAELRKKNAKNKPKLEKVNEKIVNPVSDNNLEPDRGYNSAKRKNIAENAKI